MTVAQTSEAKRIFLEAIELGTPDAWPSFLDNACNGDATLRHRVETLLQAHAQSNALLDCSGLVATIAPPATESSGTLIGPYKLLEQIGEGGMGVVYVAEQTEPVRRCVALKIIKPGMDTKQVIARFEAERQALAMMDHPHIARVLDAGTTDTGRPYFVMELVRGLPVTEYCDKARLSPRQRLELFIDVCHAVQHAHQKGVIHRDLKPSNVMITVHDGRPVAKVIDFGVAKAVGQQLTERTVYTAHTQLVGTPLYMSPEQADFSSQDVDTRSDVYSLGVLLYELLTGQTPFDKETLTKAGFDEMRRIIREDEPPIPSRRFSTLSAQASSTVSQHRSVDERHLGRVLRRELDWIVMKALEKDRSRRYESASALAADIQRYLSDEPVLACPPTAMYRFQKFARKHKAFLTTAAAIAVCLLLGTTVSAWQAARATTAEAQANANAAEAQDKAKEATAQRDEAQKQRDEVKALADRLAAKEEELERTLYADHIYMAKESWDSGNVTRATSLLKRHLPQAGESDRRGFEWHYLSRLLSASPLLSFQIPQIRPIQRYEVTLSSDRTRLIRFKHADREIRNGKLESTADPVLQVWNLQTGQQELTAPLTGLRTPSGPVPTFSPDGTRMAISSGPYDFQRRFYAAAELKVWDTRTGREILAQNGVVRSQTGRVVFGKQDIFSPDSKLLLSVMENQSVKLWDTETGQERITLEGKFEPFYLVAISSDGQRVAGATQVRDKERFVNFEVRIWDVQTGRQVQKLIEDKWVGALVFSPDGQRLATGEDEAGTVKLWDVQTGNELMKLKAECEDFWDVAFNADGTRLIAQGDKAVGDDSIDSVTMWNAQTGQQLLALKADEFEFSPDGKRVAVQDSKNFRTKVFDTLTGQIMLSVANAGEKLVFSPDSKRLATRSGQAMRPGQVFTGGIRIWDLETADEINHIKGFDGGYLLAFSQDGKRLIGGSHQTIQVWDAETEQNSAQQLTLAGVSRVNAPSSFAMGPAVFSTDFKRVAGISTRTVKLFDANSGEMLRTLKGHKNEVIGVALSPDGKRVAASDGTPGRWPPTSSVVKVWDADSGRELFSNAINMGGGRGGGVTRLAFSPDGKKLAGSGDGGATKVWDLQSGGELYAISGQLLASRGPIPNKPAFSPDGTRLAAAGKIWNAETGGELVALKDGYGCMGFSPDGKRVLGFRRGANDKAPDDRAGVPDGKRALDTSLAGCGIFDAESGELIFDVPFSGAELVTFSPDGKRLTNGRTIWDAQTGLELFSLSQEGIGGRGSVAFSPDGHRLAVVKAFGNEVTIYDATPLSEDP